MPNSPATNGSPLITVITPAYNVAEYITESIDSVLNQTERRFEYLIVDDGSSDDTVSQIESRIVDGGPVRLIKGNHGGSAAARNLALAEARGTYVAFLDGDDIWQEHFLEKQLQLIESLDDTVGAVYCRARVMTASGRVVGVRWQRSGLCDFDDMLVLNCPPRNGSSLLIKKKCFDEAGLFDEALRSGVDFEMWLRIGIKSKSPNFWGSPDYLIDLRLRPGAISNNLDKRFESMGNLLAQYGPNLQHTPLGKAYIRPALLAFRAGYDDLGANWTETAKESGMRVVLGDRFGIPMLAWSVAPPVARKIVRLAKGGLRNAVLKGPRVLAKGLGR